MRTLDSVRSVTRLIKMRKAFVTFTFYSTFVVCLLFFIRKMIFQIIIDPIGHCCENETKWDSDSNAPARPPILHSVNYSYQNVSQFILNEEEHRIFIDYNLTVHFFNPQTPIDFGKDNFFSKNRCSKNELVLMVWDEITVQKTLGAIVWFMFYWCSVILFFLMTFHTNFEKKTFFRLK